MKLYVTLENEKPWCWVIILQQTSIRINLLRRGQFRVAVVGHMGYLPSNFLYHNQIG